MDRLVDRSLSAASFAGDSVRAALPPRARTIVIGGGIVGCAAAEQLAAQGDDDVLLLERGTVSNGTTWHAAGLVSSLRSSPAMTELAQFGIETYRSLGERTGIDVSFTPCGSLMLARTPGRMDELRYLAAGARFAGITAELVEPQRVVELWPLASHEQLVGALHLPDDGHVNPGYAALALAALAFERGVAIREHVAVTRLLVDDGRVVGVSTEHGDIECERVLLACGLWTRDLAATAGVSAPLYAAEHIHVRTEPIEGVHSGLPVLRDLDGHFYVRHEDGRLLVGAFEPDGIPRAVHEIDPGGFAEFPADWEHFARVRGHAEERIPVLSGQTWDRFLNAPESFTPDGNFLLGESGEVAGVYIAAGFNSQGIILGPGAGRAIADWMISGAPGFDASAVDVRRFAGVQSNRRYLHERTTEALGRLYAMHWPQLQPDTARTVRRTPLHDRVDAAGAVFGEMTGWERANWYAPTGVERVYEYSYQRQNWFDHVAEEHRAARERVALFDLSSFTKIEVAGPAALAVLQRFCTADVDMPVGRVRYTLMLNVRGGIELDGTVVRLDDDRFWVITPAATQHKTLHMLRRLARGEAAAVFDATAGFATLAVMGPASRELVTRISPDDWSSEALGYTWARTQEVARSRALALRVSFVGELGYELYVPADQASEVYDAIVAAGKDLGLAHAGYHALDSLRSEKGYRHLGHDIGPADDPIEAGLEFTLSARKSEDYVGRAALNDRAHLSRRWRTAYVALQDPEPVLVHDEPVLRDGRIVGRLTSGSYGYSIGRACGIARIEVDAPDGGDYVIDCGGLSVPADVASVPFYDPAGLRLRA
jgi:glycine cleavage system aminomethyltransferase T/glycine/D-amino acid oxidase-like deaminating enzyme